MYTKHLLVVVKYTWSGVISPFIQWKFTLFVSKTALYMECAQLQDLHLFCV